MRIFVRFDKSGTILAASKIDAMGEGLDHPYGALDQGDDVIEVKGTPEHAALDPHEIVERYVVDVKKRKLQKRRTPARPSR